MISLSVQEDNNYTPIRFKIKEDIIVIVILHYPHNHLSSTAILRYLT